MLHAFPGYQVLELRVSTGTSCYWRARRDEDGAAVLIKSRRMGSTQHKAQALGLEYKRLQSLESPYLPKTIDANLEHEDPFLVLEPLAHHRPLDLRLGTKALSSAESIELGLHMTRALMAFHDDNLCCLSLAPDVIWVDDHFVRCVLMDLGNTNEIGHYIPEVAGCFELDAGLSYISPEQTGRLRQPLDERSDFYSLGLVLHCSLRGKDPYAHHRVPHSLIYAQLCEDPPELPRSGIAPALRGIISKLCAKPKRERYQSADGILFDLKKTRKELAFNRNLDFPAGQRDKPLRFDPSPHLYEREDALKRLRDNIDRCAQGEAGYINLEGKAGVGKSALLGNAMADFARHQMLFARGRCHAGVQGQNYGPIAEIIRSLIAAAHALPPHLRREQKQRTRRALGGHSGLLVDIIPEIANFLGSSSEPLGEFLEEQRQRACLLAMQRFILSFACHHQPLVLHFDNLQWAEYKTTSMIHGLLADPEARYLLVIGSIRQDSEISPISSWGQSLIKSGVPYTSIKLAPLSEEATRDFVTDSLSKHPSVLDLSSRLYSLTQGKPDALGEHLIFLRSQGVFYYDDKERTWKVKSQPLEVLLTAQADSGSILSQRIAQLPDELSATLLVCALLGSEVRPKRVAVALSIDLASSRARLEKLASAGFLQVSLRPWRANVSAFDPNGEVVVYRFAKDQMREHLLNAPEATLELRREVCLRLLEELDQEDSATLRRGIMRLAHPCLNAFRDSDKAASLMRLFFEEAKRAFSCTAYDRAEQLSLSFLTLAEPILPADAQEYWELGIKRLGAVQITGDNALYERLLPQLEAQCNSRSRRVELLNNKIVRATSRSLAHESLALLFELADQVQYPIDPNPSAIATKTRLSRWGRWFSQKKIDQLLAGPALRDPELLVFLDALSLCSKSAFVTNQPNLYISIISKALEITFASGLSSAASSFFARVALIYLSKSQELDLSNRIFGWAEQVLDALPHRHYQASLVFLDSLYRTTLTQGLAGCRSETMRAHRLAHDAGDEWTATHCLCQATSLSFWMGDPLTRVRERANASYRYASRTQTDNVAAFLEGLNYNLGRLMEPQLPPRSVTEFAQAGPSSFSNQASCLTHDLAFQVVLGNYDEAWELSRKLDPYMDNIEGLVIDLILAFFRSITACHFYHDLTRRTHAARDLEDGRRRLMRWQQRNPKAASPFVLVIEAIAHGELGLKSREAEGEHLENSLKELDYAIFELDSMHQYHLAALASSWGLRWCKEKNLSERVNLYAQRVQYYRKLWGASPVFPSDDRHLSQVRPRSQTDAHRAAAAANKSSDAPNHATASELLMQSCALATRVCSAQERLRVFVELIRESLVADRIVVLLDAGVDIGHGEAFPGTKGLLEVARSDAQASGQAFHFERRELASDSLPVSLIYRCADEDDAILIDCVQESSHYTQDSYLRRKQPQSVMVVPISGPRRPIGVVYVENTDCSQRISSQQVLSIRVVARALGASLLVQAEHIGLVERISGLESEVNELETRVQAASRDRRRVSSLLNSTKRQLKSSLDAIRASMTVLDDASTSSKLKNSIMRMQSTLHAIDELTSARQVAPEKQTKPFCLRTLLDKVCARAQSLAKRDNCRLCIVNQVSANSLEVFGDKRLSYRAIDLLLDFASQKTAGQELRLSVGVIHHPDTSRLVWSTELELPCSPESLDAKLELLGLPDEPGRDGALSGSLVRARELLNLLGGHMELEPSPQGIRLRSILELEIVGQSPDYQDIFLGPATEHPRGQRALVAHDDIEQANLIAQLLDLHGIPTCIAVNGLEAVQRFQAQPLNYQLIILGCSLPVMDGYQATAHIRSSLPSRAAHLPIFGLSPQQDPGEVDRCLAAGMDLHLPTPLKAEDLARALAQWGIQAEDKNASAAA